MLKLTVNIQNWGGGGPQNGFGQENGKTTSIQSVVACITISILIYTSITYYIFK